MIGEMQFLERFYTSSIWILWGCPFNYKTFALTDDFNIPRNTYDECMNFVISEYRFCTHCCHLLILVQSLV
jgi:hypothetical protein